MYATVIDYVTLRLTFDILKNEFTKDSVFNSAKLTKWIEDNFNFREILSGSNDKIMALYDQIEGLKRE